jgi:hypothetical protein
MNAEPTHVEKIRRLPWAIANSSLNGVFAQMTFAGPVLVLFLAYIGFTKTGIGLQLSFFPLCGLLALVVAPAVARFGFKRTFITFYGSRKIILALLLLTPWMLASFGQQTTLLFVTLVILVFAIVRAIAETGYNPWFQEFVPNAVRGRFSAVSNIAANVSGAMALILAGIVIGVASGLERFTGLFAIGVLFGVASITCAFFIPGGASIPNNGQARHFEEMVDTLLNRDFRLYLAGVGLIAVGSAPLLFVPLFMIEQVGIAEGVVVLLSAFTLIGGLLSSYLWSWAADRWGSKPIMLLSLGAVTIMPVAWLLVPRHSPLSSAVAIGVAGLAGLATAGWSVGSVRLLLNSIVPTDRKTDYLSVNYAWAGLIGGAGPLLAGGALDLLKVTRPQASGITLDAYTPVFIFSFVLCISSILVFRQISDYNAIRASKLASMLFKGNLLRAAGSLIQYRRARAEGERVSVTERMGSAKSLLNVDDLLDALADPSFNVRHEAIVAIARMRPDERLFNALVEVLHGNEPDLSISAAWALGRRGERRAIEPLREALESRYSLIQARSARSLATLGDYDIIPVLLERFNSEPDDGLRIAYASALGALRSRDAAPGMMPFLYATRGKDSRMELALALARIVSNAEDFVVLARQVRGETGSALSESVLALKRLKRVQSAGETFLSLCDTCADAFAYEDLDRGSQLLAALIHALPLSDFTPVHAAILCECAKCLDELGSARIEYTLLSLHTLQAALSG